MKHLLLSALAAVCLQSVSAKVAMLVPAGTLDDDEQAAVTWFRTHVQDGTVITATDALADYNAVWVACDKQPFAAMPAGFDTEALKAYVAAGGNLLLTNHATKLATAIGRCPYQPGIFGDGAGGNNPDIWGLNANIGIGVDVQYDYRNHAIYQGMQRGNYSYNHEIMPLIGPGNKEDHNCMWDLNACGFSPADGHDVVAAFQNKTTSRVLGTWQHVEDYCCAGLVEFLPTPYYKGTVLAIGVAAYEWSQNGGTNPYQSNIEALTQGCLTYLDHEYVAPEPPAPLPVGTVFSLPIGESVQTPGDVIPGAVGQALRLNGYSDVITAPCNAAEAAQLSLSVWVAMEAYPLVQFEQQTTETVCFAGTLTANSGIGFVIDQNGHYGFKTYSAGWPCEAMAAEPLTLSKWHHLVATIDGTAGKITVYDNGQKVAEGSCGQTVNPTGTFYVGAQAQGHTYMDQFRTDAITGAFDDITLTTGLLPEADINAQPENPAQLTLVSQHTKDNPWRPLYHPMPARNWTNETHGLARTTDGTYHLFFQKNANGPYWGHLQWGHLTSPDLAHWTEQPLALITSEPYDVKGCWSGTVFADPDLTAGQPNIFYTAVDYAKATIAQAVPATPDLATFTKPAGNPIVNGKPAGLSDDFRDPNMFRDDAGNVYMIVGSAKDGIGATTLHRYDKTARTWSNTGDIFFRGQSQAQDGTFWEMPTIDKIGDRWLFTTSPIGTSEGVKAIYWTGTIAADGTFRPDQTAPKKLDFFSREGYGMLSPSILVDGTTATAIGITPDKLPTADNTRAGWAHNYSLPRKLSIAADGTLIQQPAEELATLRSTAQTVSLNESVSGTRDLAPVSGSTFEVDATFDTTTTPVGITFYDGKAVLKYFPLTGEVTLNITQLPRTQNDGGVYNGIYTATVPVRTQGRVHLHLYVDRSVADIFVNDYAAASVRLFPNAATGAVAVTADSPTPATVQAWQLTNLDTPAAIALTPAGHSALLTPHSSLLYTLAGQAVAAPAQGVYVARGKKVIAN